MLLRLLPFFYLLTKPVVFRDKQAFDCSALSVKSIVSLSVLLSYFCVNKFWCSVYVNIKKCKCYQIMSSFISH